jgi:hypothetical protein
MMSLGVELVWGPLYRAEVGCLGESSRELPVCIFRVEVNMEKSKDKGKVRPRTSHEGAEWSIGIALLFL